MQLRGVFGGTFDPIHLGHLRCALEVSEAIEGPVHMIPCHTPVHRGTPGATTEQRWQMLQIALEGQPAMLADDREIRRGGPSYMVDTLASLQDDYAADRLCLVVGADAFAALDRWHRWQDLFELAHLVVISRPGVHPDPSTDLQAFCRQRFVDSPAGLKSQPAGKILGLSVTAMAISASGIRSLRMAGQSARYLVPEAVESYLQEQGLYQG